VEAFGRVGLDLFVHRLDHAVRPWVLDQGGAVFDLFGLAQCNERMLLILGLLAVGQGVIAELDAVVGEQLFDFERILCQGIFQKGGGGLHALVVVQLQIDVAGGAVDGDVQVPLVFAQVDLGRVEVEEARFVGFERPGGLFLVRQQVSKAAGTV